MGLLTLPRRPRQHIRFVFIAALFLLWPIYLISRGIHRLVWSHTYDLSYESIFRAQFQVYILTHDCRRFTSEIASNFEAVVLVPDVVNSPYCAALRREQLHVEHGPQGSKDDAFLEKYGQVLEHCARGEKIKCVILEDDIVMLHDAKRTREVLVENTLTLFNAERSAYDCTKRGFGWFRTTQTGNGSQCRIYSKPSTTCMSQCLREAVLPAHVQLDYGLRYCQVGCGLDQKRFLLAVHSGLNSIMDRPHR